jgi:hypothetical protein
MNRLKKQKEEGEPSKLKDTKEKNESVSYEELLIREREIVMKKLGIDIEIERRFMEGNLK